MRGRDGTCCLHSAAAIFAAATSSLSSELTSVLERRRIERRGLAASSSLALGCTAAEAPDACVSHGGGSTAAALFAQTRCRGLTRVKLRMSWWTAPNTGNRPAYGYNSSQSGCLVCA